MREVTGLGPGASAGVVVVAVAVSIRVAGAMGGVGAVVSVVVSSGAGVVAGTGAGAVASTGSGAGVVAGSCSGAGVVAGLGAGSGDVAGDVLSSGAGDEETKAADKLASANGMSVEDVLGQHEHKEMFNMLAKIPMVTTLLVRRACIVPRAAARLLWRG